jgi:rRNA maturation protein Nop10
MSGQRCRGGGQWALRSFSGTCPQCGRKVTVRNDGKIPVHVKKERVK